MRSITYAGQVFQVEILSLAMPRPLGLLSRGQPPGEANLTMLSPVELPIGAQFGLANADDAPFHLRVLGCVQHVDGRFVILGSVVP